MTERRNATVLMADDDPAQLLLAEAALAGAGFVVHTVGDGADAVERLDEIAPDLVILDVNMPRMSGIEACRGIRARPAGRSIPVLMLTGRNDLAAISDAFAAGASDFAQKGINPRLLVERVRFLLRDLELQEALRSSRSKLLLAQRIARVGHWELDTEGGTLHVSPMLGEILGVDTGSLRSFEDFAGMLDPAERFAARQAFVACATGEGRYSLDHRLTTSAGAEICIHAEAEQVGEGGASPGATVIVTVQDLTRLHRAEEAVRLLSYTDAATGLPNRRQLAEQLATALADENRVAATGVVAFRVHNLDALAQAEGLEAANEIVKRVAGRIELELGNASESGAVPWRTASAAVCRTAEAELALLLRSRMSAEHLAAVACAMLQSLAARAAEDRSGYSPAISAGIALAAADGLVAEQVLEQAHVAAEQATSPWRCETYSPVTLARSRRRLQVESALRGALERGEFSIAFQPRVATGSYELTGVECLARWENPELGAVPAEEFIPAAEGTGLLVELGGWVIGEACRQVAAWRAQFEREFVASVNIGAAQLADRGLVDRVKGVLETHGLPANALELELSESCTADAPPQAIESLAQLRRLGVRIAIDNLGTGYSSLTRVRRLQFDCMKLDRSLVADLYTDLGAQGVTTAVIAMARSLRVRSVAEGVEDSATLEMLAALGCDEVQGQYIAPPLAPREFAAWVEDGGATALEQRGTLEMIDALEAVERRSRNTGG